MATRGVPSTYIAGHDKILNFNATKFLKITFASRMFLYV